VVASPTGTGRQKQVGDQINIVWCDVVTVDGNHQAERLITAACEPKIYVNLEPV
jgi:hypothetical protein